MHLNAKNALRKMKRRPVINAEGEVVRRTPAHIQFNRKALREAIEYGKELLAHAPFLNQVVLHYPELRPTKGFRPERIIVTRNTEVPSHA